MSLKCRFKRLIGKGFDHVTRDENIDGNTMAESIVKTRKSFNMIKNTKRNIKRAGLLARWSSKLIRFTASNILTSFSPLFLVILVIVLSVNSMNMSFSKTMSMFISEDVLEIYHEQIKDCEADFIHNLRNYKKPGYDNYSIEYVGGKGNFKVNWREILSYMLVEFDNSRSGSDEEKKALRDLYNMLTDVNTRVVTRNILLTDDKSKTEERKIFLIQASIKSVDEIIDQLDWSKEDKELYKTYMDSNMEELYPELVKSDEIYSAEEVIEILNNLESTSVSRERVIKTALSLVGKVDYYWGGATCC